MITQICAITVQQNNKGYKIPMRPVVPKKGSIQYILTDRQTGNICNAAYYDNHIKS